MFMKSYFLCFALAVKIVIASDQVNQLTRSLENDLKFCVKNGQIIDINLLFGIAIVAGQLQVLEKYDIRNELRDKIQTLNRLCNDIFEESYRRKVNINPTYKETQNQLISPELWSIDNIPKFLNRSLRSDFSKPGQTNNFFFTEIKFREKYDICLGNLLDNCYVPADCSELILNYTGAGYTTTHQILYLQITKQLVKGKLCSLLDFINFDGLLNDKCCHVYRGINDLERRANYNDTALDLLMESVVVCGLENYAEFFHPNYLRLVLNDEKRRDYEAIVINGDPTATSALAHLISVRMAAIILHLKRLIQGHFYQFLIYEELRSLV